MDDQEILAAFPQALAAGEFVVYYQPKVRIADKSIYGAEALVRSVRWTGGHTCKIYTAA